MQITYLKTCSQVVAIDYLFYDNYFLLLGQLTNVEHFMQCRTEDAFYFMMSDHYCVSVPFDKLVGMLCDVICLLLLFHFSQRECVCSPLLVTIHVWNTRMILVEKES